MEASRTLQYSYQQMDDDLRKIIKQITDSSWAPQTIIGIVRGGLVPATYLSHYFKVPLRTVCVSFRDDRNNNEISAIWSCIERLQDFLVVDDIADSGDTIAEILKQSHNYSGMRTAVLHYNTAQTLAKPDFYGQVIDKNIDPVWINYMWEDWHKNE